MYLETFAQVPVSRPSARLCVNSTLSWQPMSDRLLPSLDHLALWCQPGTRQLD
jgi:hypothetical protein